MLESILNTYGYPIITIGTFLEGETVLILGGVSAHLGYLSLHWVIACGFIGTLLGDQLYFFLGRQHGNTMLARRPAWQVRADRILRKLERHQNLVFLGFRFLYGLRTITPFVIGMSDVSYARFTVFNVIGAIIWATTIGLAGYFFGQAMESVLGDIKHYELEVMGGIALFATLVWVAHYYRHHQSGRSTS
jgi:membrane protein DedA with SNARE-associated domain